MTNESKIVRQIAMDLENESMTRSHSAVPCHACMPMAYRPDFRCSMGRSWSYTTIRVSMSSGEHTLHVGRFRAFMAPTWADAAVLHASLHIAPKTLLLAVQLYHVKCQLSSTHESVAPLVPFKDYMVIA